MKKKGEKGDGTEPAVVVVNNEILANILKVKPGKELRVPCKNGVPLSREWRNRFRDAETDGCITVRKNPGKPKVTSKEEK
jgi:translation initiation factor IF-1